MLFIRDATQLPLDAIQSALTKYQQIFFNAFATITSIKLITQHYKRNVGLRQWSSLSRLLEVIFQIAYQLTSAIGPKLNALIPATEWQPLLAWHVITFNTSFTCLTIGNYLFYSRSLGNVLYLTVK